MWCWLLNINNIADFIQLFEILNHFWFTTVKIWGVFHSLFLSFTLMCMMCYMSAYTASSQLRNFLTLHFIFLQISKYFQQFQDAASPLIPTRTSNLPSYCFPLPRFFGIFFLPHFLKYQKCLALWRHGGLFISSFLPFLLFWNTQFSIGFLFHIIILFLFPLILSSVVLLWPLNFYDDVLSPFYIYVYILCSKYRSCCICNHNNYGV